MSDRKTAGVMGIVLGLITCVYIFGQVYVPPPADEFAGNFVAGNGPWQTSFAINRWTGEFKYFNQAEKLHAAGGFEELGEGEFRLVPDAADGGVIPEQVVKYENLAFSVWIGESLVDFHKNNDVPIVIGDN